MKTLPPPAYSVLIVDDDPSLRRTLARILEQEGHAVLEAADGPSALELARVRRPSLVVLDDVMPGMDGETVLASMQRDMQGDAPPTVLLTGSRARQKRAKEIGAVVALEKPFIVEDLLDVVERYVGRERARAS